MDVRAQDSVQDDGDSDSAVDRRPGIANKRRHSASEERDARADEREALADQREADLDAREERANAWDAGHSDHEELIHTIQVVAGVRDDHADARDSAATSRDTAASLRSFLHDDEFIAALRARRFAALDRLASKADRTSAASDRTDLTEAADPASARPDRE
jgi:hypothetical protein